MSEAGRWVVVVVVGGGGRGLHMDLISGGGETAEAPRRGPITMALAGSRRETKEGGK